MTTNDANATTHARGGRSAIIEPGVGYLKGLRELPRHLTLKSISAGTVAAIFGCSGPALIVIGAAEAGGLTGSQTVSWLFAIYFLGGLISLVLAPFYMQPVVGAYSIPGAAILVGALTAFDFNQAVGAFIMAGVLVLLLGLSGVIGRVMRWLPMPIVMAMIAGALIRFGTGVVTAVGAAPLIVGAAVIAFFVVMRFVKAFPPVLAALIVGVAMAAVTGSIETASIDIAFAAPTFTVPTFTLDAFLAISVPLAILVIGAENAQATGVLMVEGYRPPINAMTVISGVGGILAGLLGGHNANIAGPMTAICSSEQAGEDKGGRYAAAVVNGVLFAAFGIVAGYAVPIILALPRPLIGAVAGLAMIGVLLTAFQQAFSAERGHQFGAFVALIVAMSDMKLLSISAPFWALLLGVLASWLADRVEIRRATTVAGT
ncbi:benzoate transporter [Skermanella stibiiresistens SB22]|uniref:Benzoate transporter n=1 Tax=Skermanella stibiiresistens SB22 TaxID=1385369 RepID=W9HAI7_9PROT|nr:benzoate/H(+) symporter BenE family transporter [Skermanella stibiiresistens]EWY40873.1 benzoate transporter [Skermanella stibiiresistens SB22]